MFNARNVKVVWFRYVYGGGINNRASILERLELQHA